MIKFSITLVIKIQSYMFKKNKKTTLAGLLAAVGMAVSNHPNPIIGWIGQGLTALATVILGASAADAVKP